MIKASVWKYTRYPLFYLEMRKFPDDLSGERFNIDLSKLKIPQVNMNIDYDTKQILEKYFGEEELKDEKKKLYICSSISKGLVYKNPCIANELLNTSISLSIKHNGKYNKELIQLYILKSKVLIELGDVDIAYEAINNAFLITLLNYSYNSLEVLDILNTFRKFSLRIDESLEHILYCDKMTKIIKKLEKNEKINSIKLYFYKLSLLDGMTSNTDGPNSRFSYDDLKSVYSQFDSVSSEVEYKNLIALSSVKIKELDFDSQEKIFFLKYFNLKLKNIFIKLNNANILEEIRALIDQIDKTYKPNDPHDPYLLIHPYILMIKINLKQKNMEILENSILNDFHTRLIFLFEDSILLISNTVFMLVNSLLSKEKEIQVKLINLINFIGDNYESYFKIRENPQKMDNNLLYADLCYTSGYLARDRPDFNPILLVETALYIYLNILGVGSEKYKSTFVLYEILKKNKK
jgi:hypothetical protein